jgi:hypothetical protein
MATASTPQTTDAPPPAGAGPVSASVKAAVDHAAAAVSSAGPRMQDGAAAARETLADCVEEVRLLGQEGTESARSAVRARPLTVLVAALAVGMLVGRLCR